MNPRNTWIWVTVAAGLLAFIYFFERRLPPPPSGPEKILADFQTKAVTAVQIQPAKQMPFRLQRTNGHWRLVEPVVYPARSASVDSLLAALETLFPAHFISPAELKNRAHANEEFGFNPPQVSLTFDLGGGERRVWIGARTPPGDQIYLQVVGQEGIHVVDAALLKLMPAAVNVWRDPALVDFGRVAFDGVVVTNAGNVLELQRDPTNKLWRMLAPNKAMADTRLVEEALQQLQHLRVDEFVSDDPKADLEAFGLQTPEFALGLRQGTNTVLAFAFGASPTNQPGKIYARRLGLNAIVLVDRAAVEAWRASRDFSDFLDRHLVSFAAAPDHIEVQAEDQFALQRQHDNSWRIVPQDLPADAAVISEVVSNFAALEATIVRHVVPEPELPAYGLEAPARRYILKKSGGVADTVIARLDFGIKTNGVFARRTGESTVYSVDPADLGRLPWTSWQMRDRHLGNFVAGDAVRITIRQEGRVRELVRAGTNSWSLAPGSQGILDEIIIAAIEETVHRLGELRAVAWLERGDQNRAGYGFKPDGWQITVELKDGRKFGVEFGAVADTGFVSAQTLLGGEPWIFEFPQRTYLLAQRYLTIPAGLP